MRVPYTFQAEPFFTIEEHLRELCEKCREAMEESKEFIARSRKAREKSKELLGISRCLREHQDFEGWINQGNSKRFVQNPDRSPCTTRVLRS